MSSGNSHLDELAEVEVVPTDRDLRPIARVLLLIGGVGLAGLLLTARLLQPSSDGFGTHRQLGMPACSLVAILGVRCPSCGMTTSWVYWMRGDVLRAVEVNAGGSMLALAATLGGPWTLVSGLRGRYVWFRLNEYFLIAAAVATVVVVLIQWGWRMLV